MKNLKKFSTLFLGIIFFNLHIENSPIFTHLPSLPRHALTISELDATNIIDKLICNLFHPNENIEEIITLRKKIIETVLKNEKVSFDFYVRSQISYNPENIRQKTLNLIVNFIEQETDKSINYLLKSMDFGIYQQNEPVKYQAALKTKFKIQAWVINLISDYTMDHIGTLASFFGKSLENKIQEQIWVEINNFCPLSPK